MKRNAPTNPKVGMLADMLGIRRYEAVGILELLWHFTAQYAPRGDIGRRTDAQIAAFIGWSNEDVGRLINCLVECNWLDRNPEFRLLVHDWHEHSDGTCDLYLWRTEQNYATGHDPRRAGKKKKATTQDLSRHDATSRGSHAGARPESESESESESSALTAFQILKERPELSGLSEDQWSAVRKSYAGHPDFGRLDWLEFAKKTADAAVVFGFVELPGPWLRKRLGEWLEKKPAAAGEKNVGAVSDGFRREM